MDLASLEALFLDFVGDDFRFFFNFFLDCHRFDGFRAAYSFGEPAHEMGVGVSCNSPSF